MIICIMAMVNAALTLRPSARPSGRSSTALVFEGIRRTHWTARPKAARRLGAVLADRCEVAYCVGALDGQRGDRRSDARDVRRMRSAKLLDAAFRYLCDCRICDASLDGLRLLLARNVRLPGRFAVHIDETGDVRRAVAVWRRGLVVGVRLHERPPPGAMKACDLIALRARYYGMPD